jgi:hypothetical protein
VAGVQVRPELGPASVDGIRFAHRQAHVRRFQDPLGSSSPEIVQRGKRPSGRRRRRERGWVRRWRRGLWRRCIRGQDWW